MFCFLFLPGCGDFIIFAPVMIKRLGERRLSGLITGEYPYITIGGVRMTAENVGETTVFKYGGHRLTLHSSEFDWTKKNALQKVCDRINKHFGL